MSNFIFILRVGKMAGGVQPLDRFKEGYCLKANTVNGNNNEIWVFCYDTEIKRDDWMEALRIVTPYISTLIIS
jgi:hypothetical protein